MNQYVLRKLNLSKMGYTSYQQYLRSPLWKSIREKKIKGDPCCYGCGRPAQQIHHSTYSLRVLIGEDSVGLWSVCKNCHFTIEFTKDGYKRSPKEATDELKRIRKMRLGFQFRKYDYRTGLLNKARSIRARYAKRTKVLT